MKIRELSKKLYCLILIFIFLPAGFYCIASKKAVKTSQKTVEKPVHEPDPLEEDEKRETEELKLIEVKGPLDLSVLSVSAGVSEILEDEKQTISIPIGAATPVECTLSEANQSPASIVKGSFEKIKGNKDNNEVVVKNIDSGIIMRIPFIYMETKYTATNAAAKEIKILKLISLASLGFSLTCLHNEAGYHKTFTRVMESLAGSKLIQKYLKQILDHKKRQISIININDRVAGFMENYLFDTSAKIANYYSNTNMILLKPDNELVAGESIDDVNVERSTGNIISAKYNSYENNSTQYEIELKLKKDNKYFITGTYLGKIVQQSVSIPGQIKYEDYVVEKLFNDMTRSDIRAVKFFEYSATEPDKATESNLMVKTLSGQIATFGYKSAKGSMEMEVDNAGILRVEMRDENTKIIMRRVYSE